MYIRSSTTSIHLLTLRRTKKRRRKYIAPIIIHHHYLSAASSVTTNKAIITLKQLCQLPYPESDEIARTRRRNIGIFELSTNETTIPDHMRHYRISTITTTIGCRTHTMRWLMPMITVNIVAAIQRCTKTTRLFDWTRSEMKWSV